MIDENRIIQKFEEIWHMAKEHYGNKKIEYTPLRLIVNVTFHVFDESKISYFIALMRMYKYIDFDEKTKEWWILEPMPKLNYKKMKI